MKQAITVAEVETRLRAYVDPDLAQDLVTAKAIKNITLHSDSIQLEVVLGFPIGSIRKTWLSGLRSFLSSFFPDKNIEIALSSQIDTHVGYSAIRALPQIKNLIAVASGKGGGR